jgi:hypothetical protein
MKYALYFAGVSIFALAGAIAYATAVLPNTVKDARYVIEQAPFVMEKAQKTIDNGRAATIELKAALPTIESLKSAMPSNEQTEQFGTTAGKFGANAIKGFADRISNSTEKGSEGKASE